MHNLNFFFMCPECLYNIIKRLYDVIKCLLNAIWMSSVLFWDYPYHPGYYFDRLGDNSDHPLHLGEYPDHPNFHPCHLSDYFDHPDDCPHHPGDLLLTILTILMTILTILGIILIILVIILIINFIVSKQSKIWM